MLEAENWKVVLELYNGHPVPALLMAEQLTAIKQFSCADGKVYLMLSPDWIWRRFSGSAGSVGLDFCDTLFLLGLIVKQGVRLLKETNT
jgi:hypothetical protein